MSTPNATVCFLRSDMAFGNPEFFCERCQEKYWWTQRWIHEKCRQSTVSTPVDKPVDKTQTPKPRGQGRRAGVKSPVGPAGEPLPPTTALATSAPDRKAYQREWVKKKRASTSTASTSSGKGES